MCLPSPSLYYYFADQAGEVSDQSVISDCDDAFDGSTWDPDVAARSRGEDEQEMTISYVFIEKYSVETMRDMMVTAADTAGTRRALGVHRAQVQRL